MLASVDGTKSGWLIAICDTWPLNAAPCCVICPDFRTVLQVTQNCSIVVVDMPIGLPSDADERTCDILARRMLGSRKGSSVFRTPPRQALLARSPAEYQAVHREITGKGSGYPVYGIVDKLRQVDSAMTPDLQTRIFEFHPELAFFQLASYELDSKHKASGLDQRHVILHEFIKDVDIALEWSQKTGSAAKLDDMMDALAGLSVAHYISTLSAQVRRGEFAPSHQLNRLPPETPPRDARGLRMEIWF